MSQEPVCKDCDLSFEHYHTWLQNDFGEWVEAIISTGGDPRAEVRDPDTGEVIFPAVKGPLRLIVGGASQ